MEIPVFPPFFKGPPVRSLQRALSREDSLGAPSAGLSPSAALVAEKSSAEPREMRAGRDQDWQMSRIKFRKQNIFNK